MSAHTENVQHTPGPWEVEHPFDEPGVYVGAPSTALVCKLYPVDGRWVGDKREDIDANARLIAAAPEMLAALEYALEAVDYYHEHEGASEMRKAVRAAIAKAEGRAA
jgi:hypothetical protein